MDTDKPEATSAEWSRLKKLIIITLIGAAILMFTTALVVKFLTPPPETPPNPFPQKHEIKMDVIIEERTGDMTGWEKKPVGWYERITGENTSWYTDTMKYSNESRAVYLILVTEDQEPQLKFNSLDGYYYINADTLRLIRVPRGYPAGGKRVYQVGISYSVAGIKEWNLITIRDDYYDVKDEIFHLEFAPPGTTPGSNTTGDKAEI